MLAVLYADSGARACSKCVLCTEMPGWERTAASFCLLPNHQTAVEPLRLHRGGIVCSAAARVLNGSRLSNALPHETGSGRGVRCGHCQPQRGHCSLRYVGVCVGCQVDGWKDANILISQPAVLDDLSKRSVQCLRTLAKRRFHCSRSQRGVINVIRSSLSTRHSRQKNQYPEYLPSLSVARQGLSRRAITHSLKPHSSIAQETLSLRTADVTATSRGCNARLQAGY
jgi:hypothetical protein